MNTNTLHNTLHNNWKGLTQIEKLILNRNQLKSYLEKLIKIANTVDFGFKDIYSAKLDIYWSIKKIFLEGSSFNDESKLQPISEREQARNFYENPRYIYTQFIKTLIDNIIFKPDLTYEELKNEIDNFEQKTGVEFKNKKAFLRKSFHILKEEKFIKREMGTVEIGMFFVQGLIYKVKTKITDLIPEKRMDF